MDNEELRDVGNSIDVGDEITIGELDVNLTVTAQPMEDHTGALLIEANKKHHPQQGVVTSVMISLDHPSGGENLEVSRYELEETDENNINELRVGERLDMEHYKLQSLSIVG